MTLPYERTRSVLRAKSFLAELLRAGSKEVAEEARAILRHYPTDYEVERWQRRDEDAIRAVATLPTAKGE